MAMVEDERASRIVHVAMHQCDNSARWGYNWRAYWHRYVDAIMRLPWLSVEEPLTAIDTGYAPACRPNPAAFKIRRFRIPARASAICAFSEQCAHTDSGGVTIFWGRPSIF